MMSSFMRRKAETMFVRLDIDGDGLITVKDFTAFADKLMKSGKLDNQKGTVLKEKITKKWNNYFKLDGGEDALTKERFGEIGEKVFRKKEFQDLSVQLWHIFFAAMDVDGDGLIQEKEYIQFFEIIGICEEAARASFQTIDVNHDGVLSVDEYVNAGIEYLSSEDQASPSRFFWGPLL